MIFTFSYIQDKQTLKWKKSKKYLHTEGKEEYERYTSDEMFIFEFKSCKM